MNDYSKDLRPACFYKAAENGAAVCELCPHNCKIQKNSAGFCGIRKNIDGKLYAASYGRISGAALDPVEKKPLYMFHPGTYVLSIGGFGCNFRCPFCQNCDISLEYEESLHDVRYLSPEYIMGLALKTVPDGNIGVAYTYNEPFIGYEFLYDCAQLVRDAGLFNVVVTNGYINREPLETLLPLIDAMNIDLKGFSAEFYKKLKGGFEPVKETIELSQNQCHVELTTLIIPGENDSEEEIEELARWIASLDNKIPLHLTRFFPRHKYSHKLPASRESVYRLSEIAKKYLKNVFTGNMG